MLNDSDCLCATTQAGPSQRPHVILMSIRIPVTLSVNLTWGLGNRFNRNDNFLLSIQEVQKMKEESLTLFIHIVGRWLLTEFLFCLNQFPFLCLSKICLT